MSVRWRDEHFMILHFNRLMFFDDLQSEVVKYVLRKQCSVRKLGPVLLSASSTF